MFEAVADSPGVVVTVKETIGSSVEDGFDALAARAKTPFETAAIAAARCAGWLPGDDTPVHVKVAGRAGMHAYAQLVAEGEDAAAAEEKAFAHVRALIDGFGGEAAA